jgi:transcription antitermination factor NusG
VLVSPEVISLFKLAMDRARASHREQIEANDLFIALSQNVSSPLSQVLGSFNINQETLMEVVRACARTHEPHPPSDKARTVRIKSGPYASFAGKVEEFSETQPTVKVAVTAFGRTVILEINRSDVEELTFIRR